MPAEVTWTLSFGKRRSPGEFWAEQCDHYRVEEAAWDDWHGGCALLSRLEPGGNY